MMRPEKKTAGCPVETTLDVIGGRWKVLVLHALMDGTQRFGQLAKALAGVSARTLAKQLRELERDGVIHRRVYEQIPPKVEYSLTPLGRKLKPVLMAMHAWGESIEKERAGRRA
ncbi:MAG: helix-turn-helix transcriptional regulator [Pirellulaceae bacterium]|jgi:DNA-binding HxlR family transcriptional regulator|nr:helix-turn-helix transcriptional regulator [Pirellulaceae bacterium]